jgi:uncharacterized protein YyaL (SSP411 family)
MPNRLARETSPYLLQHADNPVDWYPWGDEAFQQARSEDKPVLLSIGYSACHWCHVMEHESFENEEIAGLMNDNFICIKVDREERPDLDQIYMAAVQAMASGGGWPLTVFLTPDARPFFGGTYFPPEDRQGLPGFPRVLKAIAEAYRTRRETIDNTTNEIAKLLYDMTRAPTGGESLAERILKDAFANLVQGRDTRNGGFDGAPKFPHPMAMEFLLRYYQRYHDPIALETVELTLEKMSRGGIYDQIGGGFHRYTVDGQWQVPHFEKMLYDNALLSRCYLQAYRVTGRQDFAEIAKGTLDYVLREMRSPEGGFYSTQDADSEGEEGKYYLWSPGEIIDILGLETGLQVIRYFGVTDEGNFEGRNILHLTGREKPSDTILEAKKLLLREREKRIKPGRDEKVLASWNGLLLTSLAEAAGILKRQDYLDAAIAAAKLLTGPMTAGGSLMHVFMDGRARIEGFLEDYAAVCGGLLSLYRTTFESKWLKASMELAGRMVENFYDDKTGLLFDTPKGQKDLIVRPRNENDGATPAGTSLATDVLLKLAVLSGNAQWAKVAERGLHSVKKNLSGVPLGYSQWLNDLDFYVASPMEIIIAGKQDTPETRELLEVIEEGWHPNRIVAAYDPNDPETLRSLPVFEGRGMVAGRPAAYVCRKYTCQTPATSSAQLKKQLGE